MLRAVCSWFALMSGRLIRHKGLAVLVGVALIAGGVWMMSVVGGLPEIRLAQFFASADEDICGPNDSSGRCELPLMQARVRKTLEKIMHDQVWAEGYSPLKYKDTGELDGKYWVIFRGTKETGSHVDEDGTPITVLCLHLYAEPVRDDSTGLIAPHPYFFGFLMWHEVLVKCLPDYRQQIGINPLWFSDPEQLYFKEPGVDVPKSPHSDFGPSLGKKKQ